MGFKFPSSEKERTISKVSFGVGKRHTPVNKLRGIEELRYLGVLPKWEIMRVSRYISNFIHGRLSSHVEYYSHLVRKD